MASMCDNLPEYRETAQMEPILSFFLAGIDDKDGGETMWVTSHSNRPCMFADGSTSLYTGTGGCVDGGSWTVSACMFQSVN